MYFRLSILFLFFSGGISLRGWQTEKAMSQILDTPGEIRVIHAPLKQALKQIAKTYGVPIFAELASPEPELDIPKETTTARRLLDGLALLYPQYKWTVHGSIVYFYDDAVRDEPGNFLNAKLKSFTISGTIADVDLRLKSEVNKVRLGINTPGGLIVGLSPIALRKGHLPKVLLENVTGREIMFRLAEIAPEFYTAISFPRGRPLTEADIQEAFAGWVWDGIDPAN